ANTTARHNTIKVLSIKEVYIVCQIFGGRYGGNSKVKKEACPLNMVLDNSHELKNVNAIPKTTIPTTAKVEIVCAIYAGTNAPTKIVAINIWVGQRPLQ